MDRHRVSDMTCSWIDNRLLGGAVEWDLKLTNTIHTVKETEEMNSYVWATERSLEILQISFQFDVLVGGRVICARLLIIAKRFPCKMDHFFVALGEKTEILNHLCEKAGCVRTSRKPKNVNVVPRDVIAHCKLVTGQNMTPE